MPANTTSLHYKTFCWNIGTTSFRTKQLNRSIEQQLQLLDAFWKTHKNEPWVGATQYAYYQLMHQTGFTTGDEARPDKAARQKTAALVDLGIIYDDRRLTPVGHELQRITQKAVHAPTGFLRLPPDSHVYLQQLLKASCSTPQGEVRPLPVILHLLATLGTLSEDEFTYLAPLAITEGQTNTILKGIQDVRLGRQTIDDIIYTVLLSQDNYQQAHTVFLKAKQITERLLCSIGLNRKSRTYDKPYFHLWCLIRQVFLLHDTAAANDLLQATARLTNVGQAWRNVLFDTAAASAIKKAPDEHTAKSIFHGLENEGELRERFFRVMHVIKARHTLRDYADLNRRYLRLTNIFRFADSKVELDVVPKFFFRQHDKELYALAYTSAERLTSLTSLEDICPTLAYDEAKLLSDINKELGLEAKDTATAGQAVEELRYQRLSALIDQRFTDDRLLTLLDCFDKRKDQDIAKAITDNADAPTCFEYVLAIIWYKVSGRTGRVLDFMKLSLDADLLPVSHAAGGEADIVYEYEHTAAYPAHHLLLEATLAERTNQRRMEMEPVSRHLGAHLLKGHDHSYAVFATTYLDPNVVSDFKMRKHMAFYDATDTTRAVQGMMIIPIDTDDLRHIIRHQTTYADLYRRYTAAYAHSDEYSDPLTWRTKTIIDNNTPQWPSPSAAPCEPPPKPASYNIYPCPCRKVSLFSLHLQV